MCFRSLKDALEDRQFKRHISHPWGGISLAIITAVQGVGGSLADKFASVQSALN
jgi:hypothetical protein